MQVAEQKRTLLRKEYSAAQFLAEVAVADSVHKLEVWWNESLEAERIGDITRALEIHDRILSEVGRSYVAYLRAGWLNAQAGGYRKALEYYEKASRRSPGSVAPLFGAMGCYVAMGDPINASRMVKSIVAIDELSNVIPLHAPNNFYAQPPMPYNTVDRSRMGELLSAMGA